MDQAFPGSKFILTVRDSAEQWFESLVNFHGKYWSSSGQVPPTAQDVSEAVYWRRGFLADYCREVFRTPISDPYNREILLSFYKEYNREVENYFADRPEDFHVLNVGRAGACKRMRKFLDLPAGDDEFPWINKT